MANSKLSPQQARLSYIMTNVRFNNIMPTKEDLKFLDDITLAKLYRFTKSEPRLFTSDCIRMINNYRKGI